MQSILLILVVAAASTYAASLVCRVLQSCHRRPGWFVAPLVAACLGSLAVLAVFQGDLFRPSKWDSGKVSLAMMAPICFGVSSFIAIIPAWYVVAHYRDKADETDAQL